MRHLITLTATLTLVTLYGCASLSEQDCLLSDWHAIGYEDGVRGYSAARVSEHRKACTKHGIAPDLAAYRHGRDRGLREFCRSDNGFQLGAAGRAYSGVCPDELAEDFSTAYFQGRRLYDLEADVRSASSRISGKRKRLQTVDAELASHSGLIVSETTVLEERLRLLAETRNLVAERGQLVDDIARLKRERARRERKLTVYRSQLAGLY